MLNSFSIKHFPLLETPEEFYGLPYRIYSKVEKSSCWVPPIKSEEKERIEKLNKMTGFSAALLVYKNQVPVCRAIVFQAEAELRFGFLEMEKDSKAAEILFNEIEKIAKENQLKIIKGDFSFDIFGVIGILKSSFENNPSLFLPGNAPYYSDFLEQLGYSIFKELYVYKIDIKKIRKTNPGILKNITLEKLTKKNIKILKDLYNEIFYRHDKENLYPQMSKNRFEKIFKEVKFFLEKKGTCIAFKGPKPIGFLICFKDISLYLKDAKGNLNFLSLLKILAKTLFYKKQARIALGGIIQESQNTGLSISIFLNILCQLQKKGYEYCEYSWVDSKNTRSLKLAKYFGGERTKTICLYEKGVS